MFFHWYYIPLLPATALNFIASLLLILVYRPTSVRWHSGCLEMVAGETKGKITRIWSKPQGQCLGTNVQWYAAKRYRDRAHLRVHERCHAIQAILVNAAAALILTAVAVAIDYWWIILFHQIAFGVAYGVHFLIEWIRRGFGPWKNAYRSIWAERQAYNAQDEFIRKMRPWAWGAK